MALTRLAAFMVANPTYGPVESAVEVLLDDLGGITPTPLALTTTLVSASGSVAAGARFVQFVTSSDFDGSINGGSYVPGSGQFFPPINGYVYPAIPYVINAGSITITTAI
jgi:hypothetical protein